MVFFRIFSAAGRPVLGKRGDLATRGRKMEKDEMGLMGREEVETRCSEDLWR